MIEAPHCRPRDDSGSPNRLDDPLLEQARLRAVEAIVDGLGEERHPLQLQVEQHRPPALTLGLRLAGPRPNSPAYSAANRNNSSSVGIPNGSSPCCSANSWANGVTLGVLIREAARIGIAVDAVAS